MLSSEWKRCARVILAPILSGWLCCALAGSLNVELKADIRHVPALAEVSKTAGIRYSREFREHGYSYPSQRKNELIFGVGAASVRVFDDVFSKVFRRVVVLKDNTTTVNSLLDVVIEPSIQTVSVQMSPPLAERWLFIWARITYLFEVKSSAGDILAVWTVTGYKEVLGDSRLESQKDLWARALTRSIEDAAVKFMRSFYDVPEAKRWTQGLPQDGSNVTANTQIKSILGKDELLTVIGGYPGITRVQVRPITGTKLALEIVIANESAHRLFVRSSDIELVLSNGKRLRTVPIYAHGATQLPPIQVKSDGSGFLQSLVPLLYSHDPSIGGVFQLISLLFIVAEMEATKKAMKEEKQELDAYLEEYRGKELQEVRLSEGQETEGIVYFISSGTTVDLGEVTLVIPVINLDTATRYTLKLPIKINGGAS